MQKRCGKYTICDDDDKGKYLRSYLNSQRINNVYRQRDYNDDTSFIIVTILIIAVIAIVFIVITTT